MSLNVREELEKLNTEGCCLQFNDVDVAPETIKAIMINEHQ